MTKREPKEILPTMKIDADKDVELDLAFSECQATILEIKDVQTKKFGDKIVMTLENEDLGKFCIFLNNYSVEKLNEAFGSEDEKWKGKLVDLKQEKDKQFSNDMIVVYPVA